jgi:hypothetical protein
LQLVLIAQASCLAISLQSRPYRRDAERGGIEEQIENYKRLLGILDERDDFDQTGQ